MGSLSLRPRAQGVSEYVEECVCDVRDECVRSGGRVWRGMSGPLRETGLGDLSGLSDGASHQHLVLHL